MNFINTLTFQLTSMSSLLPLRWAWMAMRRRNLNITGPVKRTASRLPSLFVSPNTRDSFKLHAIDDVTILVTEHPFWVNCLLRCLVFWYLEIGKIVLNLGVNAIFGFYQGRTVTVRLRHAADPIKEYLSDARIRFYIGLLGTYLFFFFTQVCLIRLNVKIVIGSRFDVLFSCRLPTDWLAG